MFRADLLSLLEPFRDGEVAKQANLGVLNIAIATLWIKIVRKAGHDMVQCSL